MTNEEETSERETDGWLSRWMNRHHAIWVPAFIASCCAGSAAIVYHTPRIPKIYLDDGRIVSVKKSLAKGYIEGKVEMPRVVYVDEDGDKYPDYKTVGPDRMEVTEEERESFHKTLEGLNSEGQND